jgi:uncharacterized membrane protein YfhO
VNWPGWRAYVNGRRLPAVTVNGAFVGCFIPPGGGRVLLRYRPAEYDAGLKLGGIALLLLAICLITWTKLNRRKTPTPVAAGGPSSSMKAIVKGGPVLC